MIARARLGILGGTLDPVHNGHLQAAAAARTALALDRVVIMPSRVPPHRARPRPRRATTASRWPRSRSKASRVSRSATWSCCSPARPTRQTRSIGCIAVGVTPSQIFFITGRRRVRRNRNMASLSARAGHGELRRDRAPGSWHRRARVETPGASRAPDVSATSTATLAGHNPSIFLVDAPTPDVSSTAIRARLAAGQSAAGMVPAAVEALHHAPSSLWQRRGEPGLITTADHLHGQD